MRKLRDYCLESAHEIGKHKARLFRARLGLTGADAELLRDALLAAVADRKDDLRRTRCTAYGALFTLDFTMTTMTGSSVIRSGWIIRTGGDTLTLVTCFPLRSRR